MTRGRAPRARWLVAFASALGVDCTMDDWRSPRVRLDAAVEVADVAADTPDARATDDAGPDAPLDAGDAADTGDAPTTPDRSDAAPDGDDAEGSRDVTIDRCPDAGCPTPCAFGTADCNGDDRDGCEVNTQTSRDHCGACGARVAPFACQGGRLVNTFENPTACGDTLFNCRRGLGGFRCSVGVCNKTLGRLALGDAWSCYLRSRATSEAMLPPYDLVCWGRYPGRSTGAPYRPEVVTGRGELEMIAGHHQHLCAVALVGGARRVRCWGSNARGELGATDADAGGVEVALPGNALQVSAHAGVSCAVTEEAGVGAAIRRRIWCWGDNTRGQLGNGTTTPASSATPVEVVLPQPDGGTPNVAAEVSVGPRSACAATADGRLFCWGNNRDGVLANRPPSDTVHGPTQVVIADGDAGVAALPVASVEVAGAADGSTSHACAMVLGAVLHVRCWGANGSGQVVPPMVTTVDAGGPPVTTPTSLPSGNFTLDDLATGPDFNCAVRNIGTVYCWGNARTGATARADRSAIWTGVSGLSPWRPEDGGVVPDGSLLLDGGVSAGVNSAAAGEGHVCAVMRAHDVSRGPDLGVKCWGSNRAGQLGNGTLSDSTEPVQVLLP